MLAWGLSVYAARQHYPSTRLVTDDDGARLLVDDFDLPFEHVSTGLNSLDRENPDWWALGKLQAYHRQTEPFVHIDTDVFLWQPLPRNLETAAVFTQCPEPIIRGRSCYRPEVIEEAIGFPKRGWLPEEWIRYGGAGTVHSDCCGVFGGCHMEFIQHYSALALRMIRDPVNRAALERFPDKSGNMILLEQYLLAACVDYHQSRVESPFRDITISYIFDRIEEAYRPEPATLAGYTHLAAGAKRNARLSRDLDARVHQDLPDYYERCQRIFGPRKPARYPAFAGWS